MSRDDVEVIDETTHEFAICEMSDGTYQLKRRGMEIWADTPLDLMDRYIQMQRDNMRGLPELQSKNYQRCIHRL